MQGARSVAQYRQLRSKQHVLPGRTAQSARYLGPHLNTANTFGAELKQRVHAMIRASKEIGGILVQSGDPIYMEMFGPHMQSCERRSQSHRELLPDEVR
eukprot:1200507-Pyramimonas_sp.AAC.1